MMRDAPPDSPRNTRVLGKVPVAAVTVALILVLVLLRLVHLGADTPPELSGSAGLYVDEGYKTLSPRNLVLFGTTHWSPEDRYEGWISDSPVTQWLYYASFRQFGADIEAARYVTVLFFALFLSGFVLGLRRRYSGVLLLGGLALLGLEGTLFLLSRIAVFEFPIIALFYGLLFVFARMDAGRLVMPVLLAISMSVLLVFGIKVSALLYLAPVFLASSLYLMFRKGFRQPSIRLTYAILAVLALVAFLVITRHEWVMLLEVNPRGIGSRILDNPLVDGSPVPVLAGILCALHLVVCRPDLCLENLYRISLVTIVLLGIPLVAVFEYSPLRYHVPFLPAYVLVVLEWTHLRGWRFQLPRSSFSVALLTVAVMIPWLYYAVGTLLFGQTALFSGEVPTLLGLALVGMLAATIGFFPSITLRGTTVACLLLVMLPLFLVHNGRQVGSFLLRPTFQAQQIRSDLMHQLPENSILGGVWAPFLALGTPFKALYVAAAANRPRWLPELAPDYVVRTHRNQNSDAMMRIIRKTPGMHVGEPVYVSTYNERRVTVYPLLFDPGSPVSRQRGVFGIGRARARAGNLADAEVSLRLALNWMKQDPATDPVRIGEARSEWGACLTRLGRYAEAEEPLLAAYEVFRPDGKAPAEVSARTTLKRLVALYDAWNKPVPLARNRSLLEAQR